MQRWIMDTISVLAECSFKTIAVTGDGGTVHRALAWAHDCGALSCFWSAFLFTPEVILNGLAVCLGVQPVKMQGPELRC